MLFPELVIPYQVHDDVDLPAGNGLGIVIERLLQFLRAEPHYAVPLLLPECPVKGCPVDLVDELRETPSLIELTEVLQKPAVEISPVILRVLGKTSLCPFNPLRPATFRHDVHFLHQFPESRMHPPREEGIVRVYEMTVPEVLQHLPLPDALQVRRGDRNPAGQFVQLLEEGLLVAFVLQDAVHDVPAEGLAGAP